jgi:hypothetical protein
VHREAPPLVTFPDRGDVDERLLARGGGGRRNKRHPNAVVACGMSAVMEQATVPARMVPSVVRIGFRGLWIWNHSALPEKGAGSHGGEATDTVICLRAACGRDLHEGIPQADAGADADQKKAKKKSKPAAAGGGRGGVHEQRGDHGGHGEEEMGPTSKIEVSMQVSTEVEYQFWASIFYS